jgi:hypothetical protein
MSTEGPAELIEGSGKTLFQLAWESGTSIPTVSKAKTLNQWPMQRRTREGLMRALGVLPRESSDQNPPQVQA